MYQNLAEAAELIEDKSPYYKYTPANVLENENFKLYWNRSILTDKTIHFNGSDITFMQLGCHPVAVVVYKHTKYEIGY